MRLNVFMFVYLMHNLESNLKQYIRCSSQLLLRPFIGLHHFHALEFPNKGRVQSWYMCDICALPNLHNMFLARGHYCCEMPSSDLAPSQSECPLYRQQTKAI